MTRKGEIRINTQLKVKVSFKYYMLLYLLRSFFNVLHDEVRMKRYQPKGEGSKEGKS